MLDTLDWYSPKYQSKHTYEEVFRWFELADWKRAECRQLRNRRKGHETRGKRTALGSHTSNCWN